MPLGFHSTRWTSIAAMAVWAAVGLACAAGAQPAFAQDEGRQGIGILSQWGDDEGELVSVSAQFTAATGERPAVLMVTADIEDEYHVYSLTQPPGGPKKTRIDLTHSPQYRLIGSFAAYPKPKSHIDQIAWVGLELQEHEDKVTWYAPIELAEGDEPSAVEIRGTVYMQACKESCIPVDAPFVAKLGEGVPIGPLDMTPPEDASETGPAPQAPATSAAASIFEAGTGSKTLAAASTGIYRAEGSQVAIGGELEPGIVQPGGSTRLIITATPSPSWHVYAYAERDDKPGSKPTLIAIDQTSGMVFHPPTTDAPIETDDSVPQFGIMRYHEGSVTWSMEIDVPSNMPPGKYPISGIVGYQVCEMRDDGLGSCELPKAARFQATLQVGDESGVATSPLHFAAGGYRDAALAAAAWADGTPLAKATSPSATASTADSASTYDLGRIELEDPGGSLAHYVLLAFVGGIILNLMPCVLPVIGLKVMSFVEQAGHSRGHALVLNIWYALGIVTVFLLLGGLAVWVGLSWGGQFGNTAFNATMAAIVFAMALSLLGVWEIPIPGFFGSGKIQDVAAREGPTGAFLKGAVTTVLATPCTGPFMAPAIAWAVNQPADTTLTVFGSLGLGMASPYLVVGVFPELLRFLPKPGPWMETFKKLTGVVLLATVAYILWFITPAALVPTLVLLAGIGLACWLVARTPLSAELGDKLQTWGLAGAVVLMFAVGAFGWLYPDVMLPRYGDTRQVAAGGTEWQPFSLEKLQQVAVEEGRTVLVDFSAEWCLTCKFLERTVLHTEAVERAIDKSGAVTMYADFTDYPPEIELTLKALGSNGVPVIAIFPASAPYRPIVFIGGYTKDGLLKAIDQATGASASRKSLVSDESGRAAGSL
jgi:thiol:disulfide interchange protein